MKSVHFTYCSMWYEIIFTCQLHAMFPLTCIRLGFCCTREHARAHRHTHTHIFWQLFQDGATCFLRSVKTKFPPQWRSIDMTTGPGDQPQCYNNCLCSEYKTISKCPWPRGSERGSQSIVCTIMILGWIYGEGRFERICNLLISQTVVCVTVFT